MKYPNIEAERARHGYSQKTFAEVLGVSTKTYQNWQGARTEIPCSQIVAMARLFEVPADYLLGINTNQSVIKDATKCRLSNM